MTFEIFLVGFVSIGIALWAKLEERRERRHVQARIKQPRSRCDARRASSARSRARRPVPGFGFIELTDEERARVVR